MIGSGWLLGALNATKIAGPAAIISCVVGAALYPNGSESRGARYAGDRDGRTRRPPPQPTMPATNPDDRGRRRARSVEPPIPTAVAIEEAAMRLFAERGYDETTMKAIAERVGVQPSAIYNHVASKQALLRDLARRSIRTLIDDTHRAIASSDDVREQLSRAVAARVELHAQSPSLAVLADGEPVGLEQPALGEQLLLREEYVGLFERMISRGVVERQFDTPAPRVATFAILRMTSGISSLLQADDAPDPRDVSELYGQLALRMLGVAR